MFTLYTAISRPSFMLIAKLSSRAIAFFMDAVSSFQVHRRIELCGNIQILLTSNEHFSLNALDEAVKQELGLSLPN